MNTKHLRNKKLKQAIIIFLKNWKQVKAMSMNKIFSIHYTIIKKNMKSPNRLIKKGL